MSAPINCPPELNLNVNSTNDLGLAPPAYSSLYNDEKAAYAAATGAGARQSRRYCGMTRLVFLIGLFGLLVALAIGLACGLGVGFAHSRGVSTVAAAAAVATAGGDTGASTTVSGYLTLRTGSPVVEVATKTVSNATTVGASSLCVPSGNVLKQPNFDTAAIVNWTSQSSTTSTTYDKVFVFEKFNYTNGETGGMYLGGYRGAANVSGQPHAIIYQSLSLESDTVYSLRMSYRVQLYDDWTSNNNLYTLHMTANMLTITGTQEFWTYTISQSYVNSYGFNDTMVTLDVTFNTPEFTYDNSDGNNARFHFNVRVSYLLE
ncbi:uncharacterized protein V1518DRAFT_407316 [Limtongia smithiae]|uniref:uncharacterized protein n=1 Tax=Limtongia smithiae TaxID=1125753 RepID=UPI0034CD1088